MPSEIDRIVQIGVVTATDPDAHKVRVLFQNTGLVSDWLCVLRNTPQVSISGATVSPWMPRVNDTVLVLYLPVFNGDGFVIGGI